MTNKVSDNLDDLSIPELEALLQNPLSEEDSELDVAFMIKVTETILRKEKEAKSLAPVDVDKAWSDFQNFYMEETAETQSEIAAKKPVKRFRRIIAIAAAVAILSALASIPVMGYKSILHMIGAWTSEEFQFVPASQTEVVSSSGNNHINDALIRYGVMQPLLPEVIPDGFEQIEFDITEKPSGNVLFYACYKNANDLIMLNAVIYADSASASMIYEKNSTDVEIFSNAGLNYYIFSNSKNNIAAVFHDNVEASIRTTLPQSFLIDWLKTIEE